MTIGIKKIAVYRPEYYIDNLKQAAKLDATEDFIRTKIGMLHLSHREKSQDTTDLAQAAVRRLFDQHELTPEQVECLVLVTQNPDNKGLPHSSSVLHHKLGIASSCAVFDISLGCSGFVQGLSIVTAFMKSCGFRNGLLVTADPYSKIIDPTDRNTALLFGDGATATWLSDTPCWDIGSIDFGILSDQKDALSIGANGCLTMNGRAVFNFAATQIPASVERLLNHAKMTIDQIDLVLLHQGSRYIVEYLAKRLGAEKKTPFAATEYGNTVSSSIPMLLAEQVPETAERLVLSGFGVGLAWATCLLEKVKC